MLYLDGGISVMDNRKSISPNEDKSLIAEVSGFCPICGDDLFFNKNGRKYKNYEIAHIYPCNATKTEKDILKDCELLSDDAENENNKLAICIKCHNKIDCERTVEEYNHLLSVKKSLVKKKGVKQMFNDISLQEDILSIVNNIITILPSAKKVKLNSQAVVVDKKITDKLLCQKIRHYVADYYKFIDNFIKSFNLNNSTYELILLNFRTAYLNISVKESDQQTIFNNMVDWLIQNCNNPSRTANEIVISYFIQHCEVFDDIS